MRSSFRRLRISGKGGGEAARRKQEDTKTRNDHEDIVPRDFWTRISPLHSAGGSRPQNQMPFCWNMSRSDNSVVANLESLRKVWMSFLEAPASRFFRTWEMSS